MLFLQCNDRIWLRAVRAILARLRVFEYHERVYFSYWFLTFVFLYINLLFANKSEVRMLKKKHQRDLPSCATLLESVGGHSGFPQQQQQQTWGSASGLRLKWSPTSPKHCLLHDNQVWKFKALSFIFLSRNKNNLIGINLGHNKIPQLKFVCFFLFRDKDISYLCP